MRRYRENVQFVIYKNPLSGQCYAVNISDEIEMDKHYSDMDHFLYAPDDLFVEGIPCSTERRNGMMNFDFEHKIKLKVKTLVPAWITVSDG
jgi:hypothetical protein